MEGNKIITLKLTSSILMSILMRGSAVSIIFLKENNYQS